MPNTAEQTKKDSATAAAVPIASKQSVPTATHTKGPWIATRKGVHGVSNYTVITTPTNWHSEIARVYHGDRFANGLENAALIAAAPDLLEALKWATKQIGILSQYIETPEALAKFDQCNAAITKATQTS